MYYKLHTPGWFFILCCCLLTQFLPAKVNAQDNSILVERIAPSVCRVRIHIGRYFDNGTGFLVDDKGHIVTNYHVIDGIQKASIIFEGEKVERPVDLVAIDPELDLALLRIRSYIHDSNLRSPISVTKKSIKAGMEVLAFGYPEMGFSVTKGIVNATRIYVDIPERYQSLYSPKSHWVQTDCTINSGNSGGPLISRNGELFGINTWAPTTETSENVYFALHARHVSDVLKKSSETKIPWSKAKKINSNAPRPNGLPSIASQRPIGGKELFRTALALKKSGACTSCKGDGIVDTQTTTGGGGLFSSKTIHKGKGTCNKCSGTGYNLPKRLKPTLESAFEKYAAHDQSTKNSDQAIDMFVANMNEILNRNPKALGLILNPDAIDEVTSPRTPVGEVVAFTGQIVLDRKLDVDGSRVIFFLINGTEQLVLFVDPKHTEATSGETVLCGGIFAGTTLVPDADDLLMQIPVICLGFVTNG